ncbi:serine/threonine-protein kinase Nek3-like [Saccostrea echinata]|uniref:serine/threonine-protein kinase Nek3-like n=1 Tax=Saccostrea echinata TaxID=191078 RepID=UPI002A7F5E32|nr:serine/threonine-protein kinase Nek3-like [Saccostrea echinata]
MADNFQLLTLLGTGTFGEAWIAKSRKHEMRCVVKVINILRLSERELDQALTEVSVLGRMHHVNIVRYLDAYVHDGALNIAMEYADGGDLHKKICDQKGVSFNKEVIMDWFVQMCMALQYIHKQNILHRDLKSQNIFLTSKSIVKVGDFGIARVLKDSSDLAVTTIGTPFYLSPEICQKKPYNHKSDMWALGCVLYEMCCLSVPFNAEDLQELILKILQENYKAIPRFLGSTLSLLIKKLLDKNPENRPSADYILSLSALKPYIQKHDPKSRQLRQLQSKERRFSLPNIPTKHKEEKERKNSIASVDKENLDPKMAGKTYLVKNPKFKQLANTPNISHIVAKQRKRQSDSQEESISRAALFCRVERSSSNTNTENKPVIERKKSTKNVDFQTDINNKENWQSNDIIPRQKLEKRDQDSRRQQSVESCENIGKPPSGRKSLDSKPQSLQAFQKEGGNNFRGHAAESNQMKRVNSERRSSGIHSSECQAKPRFKTPSMEHRTSDRRPTPIGSESSSVTKKLFSRHKYPSCRASNDEPDQSETENEVFLDQGVTESEIKPTTVADNINSPKKVRRSSSYDCVFVDKKQNHNDGSIPRAKSAGSIKRLSTDGYTYNISSSLMPSGNKDTDQGKMDFNQELLNSVPSILYNSVCSFITDRSKGIEFLSAVIIRAFGKREADKYISKITESMIEQKPFQEVERIIPENKREFLPLVLCYIQMSY